jgi:type IV pilus assembly protein PilM
MEFFKRSIVGIDINCSHIRFVELRGNADAPVIKNIGSMYISDEIVKNGRIVSTDKFKAVLGELWKKHRIKSKDIVLGVSNSDIIMRFISLPKMLPNKLSNLVKFQASDFIPVNIDDYELDYSIVSENFNESGSYYNILLVAAQKKMLYEYISAFTVTNSHIKDIKSSVLVMDKIIPKDSQNSVSAVVNITPEVCNLLIVNDTFPVFARTVLFSDIMHKEIDILRNYKNDTYDTYTSNISNDKLDSKHLYRQDTSLKMAEQSLGNNTAILEKEDLLYLYFANQDKNPGDQNDYIINKDSIVNNVVNFIGGEVLSSISYFQSQNRNLTLDRIFLLGCRCFDRTIYDGLVELLGTNVEVLQPYENLFSTLSKNHDDKDFEPAEYAIALSLAMHGLEG